MVIAAFGAAAAAAVVAQLDEIASAGRGVVCIMHNRTEFTLTKTGDSHAHGGFAETPPSSIPPEDAMVFSSQSSGFATGTQGSVGYTAPELVINLSWDNPWLGSNSCDASLSGPLAGKFRLDHVCGNGNHSQNRYTLSELPFQVYGAIRQKWDDLNGMNGFLGNPLTDETGTPDGRGRYNHFVGGTIYWTSDIGAHEVHGAIRDKWAAGGWERGLGYPLTDETATPDGLGRFNHFRAFLPQGPAEASIYWTPQTGAHQVFGAIRQKWAETGWEVGIGYPTTDEAPQPDGVGRIQKFERGTIVWSPTGGAAVQ